VGLNPLTNPLESPRRTALKEDELLVFGALAFAAHRGLPCPSTAEILALLPHRKSDSTPPAILAKLERAKLIRRKIFQRGRAVEIVATGACTAEPPNLAPHWRHRPAVNMAGPSILRQHCLRSAS
jgi:hypothetical protein